MAQHPNKHIRKALKYAEGEGWTIKKAGPRSHAWGIVYCPHGHGTCWMAIYSTPKNPEKHARDIRKTIARCPGG